MLVGIAHNALDRQTQHIGEGMRILAVEDAAKTGAYLVQGLTEAGYVVDLANNGTDGLHQALTEVYDLAVLDVMLPGQDGWQILQAMRKTGKDIPVLFLTARDQVVDRVKGLDYTVCPWDALPDIR